VVGITSTIAGALGVEKIHLDAPYSLLAYTVGAVAIESMFRLFPLGLLSFLFSKLLFKGRHLAAVFWIGAVLIAVLEPLSQAALLTSNPSALAIVVVFIYVYGVVASWQLWKFGVAAPLVMRFAFYAVWHVALGPIIARAA